jgi:hypothetical protein
MDHQTLLRWIASPGFLLRLDSAHDYEQTGKRLRIHRVVQALADNPSPSAKTVLVGLTQGSGFLDHPTRVEYLLRACATVRPAPMEVIRFWDRYSQPDDGYSNVAMEGAVANGSPQAMLLLERKLADEEQPEEDRVHWIHCYILENRNDPGVLEGCQRMLAGGVPVRFRSMIVDVVFDYRPVEWFRPASPCKPPERAQAGPEARQLLRSIAGAALAMGVNPAQKLAIEKTLREIGRE